MTSPAWGKAVDVDGATSIIVRRPAGAAYADCSELRGTITGKVHV